MYTEVLSDRLLQGCRAVTLDSLIEDFPGLESDFNTLVEKTGDAYLDWKSLEPQAFNGTLGKQELFERARRAGEKTVVQHMKKDEILEAYLRHEWKKTDVWVLFDQASEEFGDIRRWRSRLVALPETLENIIVECNKFHDEFREEVNGGLVAGTNKVRADGLKYLEVAWAFQQAHEGLRLLKNEKTKAEVVDALFGQIQMAVVSLIPQNLSPTGIGLDHMAPLGGAKILTSALKGLIPQEALPFVATAHTRW